MLRDQGEFTVGSRLLEERLVNPFVRSWLEKDYFKELCGGEDDLVKVFAKIRKLKDSF